MISQFRTSARRRAAVIGATVLLAAGPAFAADMPEDNVLRGSSYYDIGPPAAVRWDGLVFGAQLGYSHIIANFEDVTGAASLPEQITNSPQFGGFLGYNWQWDNLVVGFDGAYNRMTSMETTSTAGTSNASIKLLDYATFRARAGYAFGQFLPYGFVGGAVGRMNYTTVVGGTQTAARDNAYAGGLTAGLGIDVSILPNVFVRAEYEYVVFSPVGGIRSSLNTGRAAVGIRF